MELPSAGGGASTSEPTPIPSFVPAPVAVPSFPSVAGVASSFVSAPPSSRLPPDACPPLQSQVIAPGQVMTDEQMETLRRQISVYATICQQLVEMHKATMAQQNAFSGSRYGQSSSFDSGFNPMGHKFASRQRWTPSQTQLQILEKLFQQGNGTPTKQRIKEISTELSQYGPISETNVYNWFQNRRARTKRKQQVGGSNNGESEMDTDVDSQEEKRIRTDKDLLNESLTLGHYETNSQKWEHMDGVQKGLGVSHGQSNMGKSYDCMPRDAAAAILDIKADPMAVSLQEDQGRRGTYDVTNEALRLLQNLKSANSTE